MPEETGIELDLSAVEWSPAAPVRVVRDGRRYWQCPMCTAARTPAIYQTRVECWSHMHLHENVSGQR
jgi:hypothetical protein